MAAEIYLREVLKIFSNDNAQPPLDSEGKLLVRCARTDATSVEKLARKCMTLAAEYETSPMADEANEGTSHDQTAGMLKINEVLSSKPATQHTKHTTYDAKVQLSCCQCLYDCSFARCRVSSMRF